MMDDVPKRFGSFGTGESEETEGAERGGSRSESLVRDRRNMTWQARPPSGVRGRFSGIRIRRAVRVLSLCSMHAVSHFFT